MPDDLLLMHLLSPLHFSLTLLLHLLGLLHLGLVLLHLLLPLLLHLLVTLHFGLAPLLVGLQLLLAACLLFLALASLGLLLPPLHLQPLLLAPT